MTLALLVFSVSSVQAQMVPPLIDGQTEISDALEETVRDLVERYESIRALLREQIRINETLFSREEIDNAVAGLEEELSLARERISTLEDELVRADEERRQALEDTALAQQERAQIQAELDREVAVYQGVIENLEVERILQVGPTFSPQGEVGLVGLINLPGTNLSLLAGGNYRLREQDFRTTFGATLSFFPQRNLVESWQRRRAE